jgi:drug/metabolite transporter (DMT)-like permease
MLGTCTMYAGLTMTHASVFQMLRGSVVVFTGVLSIAFLGRRLAAHHWAGMALVTAGAFLVGLSSVLGRPDSGGMQPSNPFLGNILVVLAQV